MDGSQIGELEYENFNAASAVITITGKIVHPGYAKGKMINSMQIANDFMSLLPLDEVPEKTTDYEGFFHLHDMQGNVEKTVLEYIIRDHDLKLFEQRKTVLHSIAAVLNKKQGQNVIEVVVKNQYFNMKEKITPVMHIVALVEEVMIDLGITPLIKPIRGGTDGSQLSFKGLPCPNIFAGGHNFHGRFEYVPAESMLKATEVIIRIAEKLSKKNE
jgi:tripeptide aminopeptidase